MHDVPQQKFDVLPEATELLTPFYALRDPQIDEDPMERQSECVNYQIGPKYFDVLAAYALLVGDPDNQEPPQIPIVNEMMIELLCRANKRLHFVAQDEAAKMTRSAESLVNRGVFGKITSSKVVAAIRNMDPETVDFYWLCYAACAFAMWRPRNEIVYYRQANAYLTYVNRFLNLRDSGPDYNLYLCNDRCGFLRSLQHVLDKYTVETSMADVSIIQMEMVATMSRILIAFTLARTASKDTYRELGRSYYSKMNSVFQDRVKYYQRATKTEVV